jgi:single-strand DNA-binding protein
MNIVALTGRLTAEPELKKSTSGVSVCSFSIAVARNFKKEGGPEADFIRCVAWRNTAEFICKYFKKGTKIEISGELQSRSYSDKSDGKNKTIMEVIVNQASFAESKSSSAPKNEAAPITPASPSSEPKNHDANFLDADGFAPISDDGDLPF